MVLHIMATPSSTTLSIHLSDRTLTPILSTSRPHQRQPSQTQAQALSSLTTTAVSAFDAASRLRLGIPQRIMVESKSSGPILLHSYISPPSRRKPESLQRTTSHSSKKDIVQQAKEGMRPATATPETNADEAAGELGAALVNGTTNHDNPADVEDEDAEDENGSTPPALIATIVAHNAADLHEARRAAVQMEITGREFQRQWSIEHAETQANIVEGEVEMGGG